MHPWVWCTITSILVLWSGFFLLPLSSSFNSIPGKSAAQTAWSKYRQFHSSLLRPSGLSAAVSRGCQVCAARHFQGHTNARMDIAGIPCLSDNYAWLLHERESQLTAVVDTPEVKPIVKALEERGLKLDYIINTHHHWDHTGGNEELKKKYGCKIVGPKADAARIPGIDIALAEGDVWKLGNTEMRVYDTPGHTRGHISLWFPDAEAAFTGDTLFALGCGRLFEGTPEQMWTSLLKLRVLPQSTKIYCGHEYTLSNAKFAKSVDPENSKLTEWASEIQKLRDQKLPTVPTTMQKELETNPFLRPHDAGIRQNLNINKDEEDWKVFKALREAKDSF